MIETNNTNSINNNYVRYIMSIKNKLKTKRNRKLDKQLLKYSAAAGAVLIGTLSTKGAIVYNSADLTLQLGNTSESIDLDGSSFDVVLTLFMSNSGIPGSPDQGRAQGNAGAELCRTTGGYLKNFAFSNTIGAGGGTWAAPRAVMFNHLQNTDFTAGNFSDVSPGYLGVRFTPASTLCYGWIHIDDIDGVSDVHSGFPSYHVDGYAFQDNGTAIKAGATPEPGTGLALLSLGAAGLMAWRKKRS